MTDFPATTAPGVSSDIILPFQVDALDARGRTVHLGDALDRILERHAYPEPIARLLGEAVALTVLLGSSLKFDGRFIFQTRSDGPVHMLVVDFTAPDGVRACARFDAEEVAVAIAEGRTSPAELLGNGHLAMTVDQGPDMSRYQGVVPLDGRSLEDAAHQYFAQSEQIPTRVRLAVAEVLTRGDGGKARHAWRAGGLMVQFLPENPDRIPTRDLDPGDAPDDVYAEPVDDDDAWTEVSSLVGTIADHELTDPDVSAERLLFRLFHERGVRVFDPHPVTERCRCSRDKVTEMLTSFTPDDRRDMVKDGTIQVVCEFCSTAYDFDPATFGDDES
ncbi:Hsp33 family molecular chaperone [Methylobrevis pamukkalensis]|uniref:33 kDa chaperonin n=1 Tax=Methylobrevis pamukkalensis TaxID=1439726 RepID=A0A1E3H0J1_9HYPH|nr:Hsp33 family molecular chaperone [Methylobrevis pamukkalensis]ODN69829.1 33 kDa chaperonin [Methylobrevis pamukkalensis]